MPDDIYLIENGISVDEDNSTVKELITVILVRALSCLVD